MTNDEIEKLALVCTKAMDVQLEMAYNEQLWGDTFAPLIAETIREAVIEVIETCAARAFDIASEIDRQPYTSLQKNASIAAGIRALKDSLTNTKS